MGLLERLAWVAEDETGFPHDVKLVVSVTDDPANPITWPRLVVTREDEEKPLPLPNPDIYWFRPAVRRTLRRHVETRLRRNLQSHYRRRWKKRVHDVEST